MATSIRRVDYFYTTIRNEPGEAYQLLSHLAKVGLNLLSFAAVPVGPAQTQLTLFPEDPRKLETEAVKTGLTLDGPHPALLVYGDDELGALAKILGKLDSEGVHVYASTGITDGRGSFAYVVYVRPEEYDRAATALHV